MRFAVFVLQVRFSQTGACFAVFGGAQNCSVRVYLDAAGAMTQMGTRPVYPDEKLPVGFPWAKYPMLMRLDYFAVQAFVVAILLMYGSVPFLQ